VWFLLPFAFIMKYLRRRVAKTTNMTDYLRSNVLVTGMSSLPPMLFLSLETVKCLNDMDEEDGDADEQCSGIMLPQGSLTAFLFGVIVV